MYPVVLNTTDAELRLVLKAWYSWRQKPLGTGLKHVGASGFGMAITINVLDLQFENQGKEEGIRYWELCFTVTFADKF